MFFTELQNNDDSRKSLNSLLWLERNGVILMSEKKKVFKVKTESVESEVVENELTVTAVERQGDAVTFHVKGFIRTVPSDLKRNAYLATVVGSRLEAKVKL